MTTLLVPGTAKTSLAIADLLSASSHPYILAVRSPPKSPLLSNTTKTPHPTTHLDLADSSTWLPALTSIPAGQQPITTIYLLPPPLPDFIPTLTSFLTTALTHPHTTIKRIVFLSSTLIPLGGPAHGQIHALLDRFNREGRLAEYAVLRPTWFTQNFSGGTKGSLHEVTIKGEGRIYSATRAGGREGRLAFVDVADIAAVGWHALTDSFDEEVAAAADIGDGGGSSDGGNDVGASTKAVRTSGVHTTANGKGKEYFILGPKLLTYADVADELSRTLNRKIEWVGLSVEALARKLVSATGMDEGYAPVLAGLDGVIAGGEEERIFEREEGGCVRSVVGREARPVGEVLAEEFGSG